MYDLHGPVSKFLCHSYDKAQVAFLACLAEFADWLVARGASDGQGNRFALPCPIEGDKVRGCVGALVVGGGGWRVQVPARCQLVARCAACLPAFPKLTVQRQLPPAALRCPACPAPLQVNGLTIRLLFNKDKNWTRALKHMLVDLKFILKFALLVADSRPGHAVAALQREDFAGAAGSGGGGSSRAAVAAGDGGGSGGI